MLQIQEYIDDVAFYEKNKDILEKAMGNRTNGKTEAESNVPEGFGKP